MNNEWKEITLGDAINFRRGHDLPKTKMVDGDFPVMGSNGIIGSHNEFTTKAPCVSIGRSGNVGNPKILNKDCWAHNTTLYIDDFKGNDPFFIYYFLQKLNLQNYRGGSAVPTLNRNHIHPIPVRIPPLQEQKRIANILGTLDDKIELNRKMNETLEAMAQALFKSWFVDFDPVIDNALAAGNEIPEQFKERARSRSVQAKKGKFNHLFPSSFTFNETLNKWIPEGWEVKSISDLNLYITDLVSNGSFASIKENVAPSEQKDYALFVRNTDLKNDFKSKLFVSKKAYDFLGKSKLYGGEIVLPNVGDVGTVHLCPYLKYPMTLGNNCIMIRSEKTSYWFYQYLRSFNGQNAIQNSIIGSVQAKLSKTNFKRIKLVTPSVKLIEAYNDATKNIISKINTNSKNLESLTKTRDTLLPKLISGQIAA